MEAIPWSAPLFRQFERGEKIVVVGRSELVPENFLAKHYTSVMMALPRLITAASLKWMKWRPQPGGAGCGYFCTRPT